MTKFDSDSIKNKIIERLNQDKNWQAITSNSAITALINSQAEASAEIARYAEYLFKESRWDTAQNESSILSMANMLGYQPKRKISATGQVRFSTDKGIHNVGSTISLSRFTASLPSKTVVIEKGKPFSINGIPYIVSQTSTLSVDSALGYVDTKVIQGEYKTLILSKNKVMSTYSRSKLNAYIYIPFYCSDVEDAGTQDSVDFLKVSVSGESYRIVENLLLSTPDDKDCELYNDLYSRNLFYIKFRADNQSLNINSTSFTDITISYIKSLGSKGNIDSLYKNCDIKVGDTSLYGINIDPLNNGQDDEDISSIKENAVSYYRDFYSIGTRENYETAILNMKFNIVGVDSNLANRKITPLKVKVFSDVNKTKTNVSFIAEELEDLAEKYVSGDISIEEQITSQLNKALTRLKSPQDIISFVYPDYYHFGIKCSCETNIDNTVSVSNTIQSYLDNLWGVNSASIDFDRDLLISNIQYTVETKNSSIVSNVNVDAIEAVTQVDWKDIDWEVVNKSSSIITHTCRLNFEFNKIFRNKSLQNKSRFFNFTEHSYAIRIDFLFRGANSSLNKKYNKTLIFELSNGSINPEYLYIRRDTSGLWGGLNLAGYEPNLNDAKQIYFQSTLLSDEDYIALQTKINKGLVSTIPDTEIGSIKDYTLVLNNIYDTTKESVSGYFEIGFDSIFRILQVMSLYDTSLGNAISNITLSTLQCGTDDSSFIKFKSVASTYIDVYASLLIEKNADLILEDSDTSVNLLCIDSSDSNSSSKITNLSEYKKNRFITVDCSFKE